MTGHARAFAKLKGKHLAVNYTRRRRFAEWSIYQSDSFRYRD